MSPPIGGVRAGYLSAGKDVIPDSVTNQWLHDAGSGSTLTDSEGSVDASFNGSWGSDSQFDDHTVYDGTDDRWRTDSEFGINNTNVSIAIWFYWDSSDDSAALVECTNADGTATDNGFRIREDNGQLDYAHGDGSGYQNIYTTSNLTQDGTWFLYGAALDGDSANIYLYDTDQQLGTGSGSGTRGSGDLALTGMRLSDFSRFIDGSVGRVDVSTTDTWTENEFDNYWKSTK